MLDTARFTEGNSPLSKPFLEDCAQHARSKSSAVWPLGCHYLTVRRTHLNAAALVSAAMLLSTHFRHGLLRHRLDGTSSDGLYPRTSFLEVDELGPFVDCGVFARVFTHVRGVLAKVSLPRWIGGLCPFQPHGNNLD